MDLANLFVGNEVTFNGQKVKVTSVASREDSDTISINLELCKGAEMGITVTEITASRYSYPCYLGSEESLDELLDPGEGYRLLKVGERIKEGDEITWDEYKTPLSWEKIPKNAIDRYPIVEIDDQPCRRKLKDA